MLQLSIAEAQPSSRVLVNVFKPEDAVGGLLTAP